MKQMIVFAQCGDGVHMSKQPPDKTPDSISGSAKLGPVLVQQRWLSMAIFRRVSALTAVTLLAASLGGCGSISSFVAGSMGDYIPAWAGGLPADAPPRPGTEKYDEWLRQQQAQQAAQDAANGVAPSSATAIH
jgi:hypothetical protein